MIDFVYCVFIINKIFFVKWQNWAKRILYLSGKELKMGPGLWKKGAVFKVLGSKMKNLITIQLKDSRIRNHFHCLSSFFP